MKPAKSPALEHLLEDIKKEYDVYAVMLLSVVLAVVAFFKLYDQARVMAGILAVLTILAFSIRRDRTVRESYSKNIVFSEQRDAYATLIAYVKEHRPRKAILIQYSCNTAEGLVQELMRRPVADVTVYVQHEETASRSGSNHQATRIQNQMNSLRTSLGPRFDPDKLHVYKYQPPASVCAVRLDDNVLFMGWYLYLPRSHKDGSNQKGHDTIDIYAHDVAAIVAYKNTPDFEALNDTFERLEAGYRNDESTEEVSLT